MKIQAYEGTSQRNGTSRADAVRGSALVLSLVAVTTVVVLAASFSQFASSVANRQAQAVNRKRAFYMAEAGLAESFAGFTCGKSGNVGSKEAPALLADQIADYLLAGLAAGDAAILRQAESADRTNLAPDAEHWGKPGCVVLHTMVAGLQFAEYDIDSKGGPHRFELRMAGKEARPLRVLVDGAVRIERALEQTTADWFPGQQQWFAVGQLELTAGAHVLRLEGLGPSVPHLDKWLLAPIAADQPPWPENVGAAHGLAPAASNASTVSGGAYSRSHRPIVTRSRTPWRSRGTATANGSLVFAFTRRWLRTSYPASFRSRSPSRKFVRTASGLPLTGLV